MQPWYKQVLYRVGIPLIPCATPLQRTYLIRDAISIPLKYFWGMQTFVPLVCTCIYSNPNEPVQYHHQKMPVVCKDHAADVSVVRSQLQRVVFKQAAAQVQNPYSKKVFEQLTHCHTAQCGMHTQRCSNSNCMEQQYQYHNCCCLKPVPIPYSYQPKMLIGWELPQV